VDEAELYGIVGTGLLVPQTRKGELVLRGDWQAGGPVVARDLQRLRDAFYGGRAIPFSGLVQDGDGGKQAVALEVCILALDLGEPLSASLESAKATPAP
jgi:hypothetical protein